MELLGRVKNGTVVLDDDNLLPEGALVNVVYPVQNAESPAAEGQRVRLPLVHCEKPGSVNLTSSRIAEILDAEDVSPRR